MDRAAFCTNTGKRPERLIRAQNKPINQCEIEDLFNKQFVISNNENYVLPEPEVLFKGRPWQIPDLQKIKYELNIVKNYLNDYNLNKWQYHTKQRNKAGDVLERIRNEINPELLTQAWCKFYEIVEAFPLVPLNEIAKRNNKFMSVHLCEAPGAFIAALNHWLKTNVPCIEWDWMATTLNPYYEGHSSSDMCNDDQFIRHTLDHWSFGTDNMGDIMNLKSLDELIAITSKADKDVLVVTADGSINCLNVPEEQETILSHLHFCEIRIALNLLSVGGSLLLKVFTIFECHSICLLYLLSCCFKKVCITKPATSKEGNSEMYVVCTKFKGQEHILPYLQILRGHDKTDYGSVMFHESKIPREFLDKIIECSEFFKSRQCKVILSNIESFNNNKDNINLELKMMKSMVADKYIRDYNIKQLPSEKLEIVGKHVLENIVGIKEHKIIIRDSYTDRCKKNCLNPLKRLMQLCKSSEQIFLNNSINESIEHKFSDLPREIWIRTGKIFHEINNSKFYHAEILTLQNSVKKILSELQYNIQFPSEEAVNNLVKEYSQTVHYKILIFHYTDSYDSHLILKHVHNLLSVLQEGETVVLIGFSLLTHLCVGLLYLVGHSFDSVEFKMCSNMGCLIILKSYNNNMQVKSYMQELNTANTNANIEGNAVLSVFPISTLYDRKLYPKIVELNYWVIKTYINYVANVVSNLTPSNFSTVSNI